jgi:ribosomal protein L40E
LKCPDCGAENPDHVLYCGRCSAALKEELRSKQKETASNGGLLPAVEYQPWIPRATRGWGALYVVLGICYACLTYIEIHAGQGSLFRAFVAIVFLAVGTNLLWASGSKMWQVLHRRNMPAPERAPILAEAKVLNLTELCLVVVLVCVFMSASLLAIHQEEPLMDLTLPLLVAGVLPFVYAVLPKPIIGLEARGLSVRMKSQPNELFLPFSMISRIDSPNRLIKVVLKDAPVHLRYQYFVLLGDPRAFREELEKAMPMTLAFPAQSPA